MKTMNRCFCLCIAVLLCLAGAFPAGAEAAAEDWAGQISLSFSTETMKQQVTVKTFIDGDTTHFHVPEDVFPGGVLKARYMGIDTPECTGVIEEYGKKAADFTREKLENAASIVIESDGDAWEKDSTGDRYLVWVWYKPTAGDAYRNLNIEILQNGLSVGKSTANNRYGDLCAKALSQARAEKLSMYSGEPDPDFYYGDAIELTLKELRCHLEAYNGKKVAFKGTATVNSGNSLYVEDYDAEQDLYFGISVYYGYGLSPAGLDILSVGNEARIVGTVQYYEAGDSWQVSGLSYDMMDSENPGNIQKISSGHKPAYRLLDAKEFNHGQVTIREDESENTFDFASLAIGTSVEMKGLKVEEIHTTEDDSSSSKGAMTLFCTVDGEPVQVRTAVLRENGKVITGDRYLGKTIDVKGIVETFDGAYQIKVFNAKRIIIQP